MKKNALVATAKEMTALDATKIHLQEIIHHPG
jgi:hypothetical protein